MEPLCTICVLKEQVSKGSKGIIIGIDGEQIFLKFDTGQGGTSDGQLIKMGSIKM